jgi:hypothetical protein
MKKNIELELAYKFIQKTDRNVFLTGKAGTGKTTFLHRIKKESSKRLIVVAPTGVAAINAKGVTIHSFFQMPFGPILPDTIQNSSIIQRRFNKTKIDIIKSLDLVIIDEVSMVRADLLDGIDQILRRYKDRNKVFGGVQILMIGDLQQLAPVVKPNEWDLLRPHFDTIYFFSSNAFKKADPITIELTHIYRQDNQEFIAILNEIRKNNLSTKSSEALHKRYLPDFISSKKEAYITLTTHNYRADAMNALELDKLENKRHVYAAEINGKFNEYAYPTYEKLVLKVGAQVMFIKNDSSPDKRYYNGKIGEITSLDTHSVSIKCPDDEFHIETTPEIWKNVSYSLDANSKEITEDIVGSFTQIPLRLAWAITIHKSQGLTFEKAIIDAEASFAHGQTYVALSRCKSLEGVVLKTPIKANSIINDSNIDSFNEQASQNIPDETILNSSEKKFQLNLIEDLFNYHPFLYPITRLIDIYYTNRTSLEGSIISPLQKMKDEIIIPLLKIATDFKIQITEMSISTNQLENAPKIQERFKKAVFYFTDKTTTHLQNTFDELSFTTDNKSVRKDFEKQLKNLEQLLITKTYCLLKMKDGFEVTKYLEARAKSVLETPLKTKKETHTSTQNNELFEELRKLRDALSVSENIPHFQVFTQKSLYEMCETLPITDTQLLAVNGMGKVRVEKYGAEILTRIITYSVLNKISPTIDKPTTKKTNTKKTSLDLFKNGMTVSEIAKKRDFVIGTIHGHLASFIKTGEINVFEIIPKERFETIQLLIEKTKFETISDLKNKIDNQYSYQEIKMVLSTLKPTD